jgi:hypothetical protein
MEPGKRCEWLYFSVPLQAPRNATTKVKSVSDAQISDRIRIFVLGVSYAPWMSCMYCIYGEVCVVSLREYIPYMSLGLRPKSTKTQPILNNGRHHLHILA